MPDSPKDRFLTVYGHRPVLAALADDTLTVDKVLIAEAERGPTIRDIERSARARDVVVQRVSAQRIKLLAGNGKHDNGVLADVVAPRMRTLDHALTSNDPPATVLLLDGVRTPANVGMILRTATAAGLDGIVVPHRGTASLDPLVVKASAGVAFHAPVLRCGTAEQAAELLVGAGYQLVGFTADGTESLFEVELTDRVALVLGSETDGISPAVAELISVFASIPMPGTVESLNVASAAAVISFEMVRRSRASRQPSRPTEEDI